LIEENECGGRGMELKKYLKIPFERIMKRNLIIIIILAIPNLSSADPRR
jgi:hypothetical protein